MVCIAAVVGTVVPHVDSFVVSAVVAGIVVISLFFLFRKYVVEFDFTVEAIIVQLFKYAAILVRNLEISGDTENRCVTFKT